MTSKNYLDTFMVKQLLFPKIPSAPSASVFPNNLALYFQDLKALSYSILISKLLASFLE